MASYADVERAAARLEGHAHRTPVATSRTLDERTGATVFLKCENLQRGGAFKFRGAFNAIAALDEAARRRGVVTFSSGNHGQAIAYAGRLLGAPATIVMPDDAPAMKVAATRGYGATVVRYDRYSGDREAIARGLAETEGMTVIPPYDHEDVIAGQGTAAKELVEDVGPLDVMVACLGGGGLLSGTALSIRALSPGCRIVGSEPAAGNDGQQSLAKGEIVTIASPRTIADGAATTHLGRHTFAVIRREVDEIVTVGDAQLVDAMRFMAERMKLVVEPTGCLALAAVLSGVVKAHGKRVGVILSGGNVDLAVFAKLLTEGIPTGGLPA